MYKAGTFFIVFAALAVMYAGGVQEVKSNEENAREEKSVEFDLSRLSPEGGEGIGYPIPASGSSDPVTAKLEVVVKHNGNWANWTTSNVSIVDGDTVRLRWSSTFSFGCAGSGASFETGGTPSGVDASITEPDPGNSTTFGITCSGFIGGFATDELTVTTYPLPTAKLEVRTAGGNSSNPSWTTNNISINTGENVRLRWSSTNATSCTKVSGSGFSTGGATSGTDTDVNEPSAGSSRTFEVSCTGDGGEDSAKVTVSTDQPPAPTAKLEASVNGSTWKTKDRNIKVGDVVSLRWSSTNADSCSGSGSGFSTGGSTGNTDPTVNEPGAGNSRTFTVTCTGAGGSVSDPLTISTYNVPTVTLTARTSGGSSSNPSWTGNSINIVHGENVRLRWVSTYADSCTGSGSGFSTGNLANDSDDDVNEPNPGNSRTFTVTCVGDGGEASDQLTVTTYALPTTQLRASINGVWNPWGEDVNITQGDAVRLEWQSTNADSCVETTGSSDGFDTGNNTPTSGTDGIVEPSPGGFADFEVTCTGLGGSTPDGLRVSKYNEPVAQLWGRVFDGSSYTWYGNEEDFNINNDDAVRLYWDGNPYSDNCSAIAGTGFSTGSHPPDGSNGITEPSPGSPPEAFTIRCAGAGGSDDATVNIETNSLPAPTALLKVSVNGGPYNSNNVTVDWDDTIEFNWSSSNADSCEATQGPEFSTDGGPSGYDPNVSTPNAGTNQDYTVECENSVGDKASDTLRITVDDIPTATLRVRNVTDNGSWTTSSITIDAGEEIGLDWSSTDANSCSSNGFDTSGAISGTLEQAGDISEPAVGTDQQYWIDCDGATAAVTVTAAGVPTLDTNKTSVRSGEGATLNWDTNGNAVENCTLKDPNGAVINSVNTLTGNHTVNSITETSTYTLDCGPGKQAERTIRVVPKVFET